MEAKILTIGDELLIGQVIDSNSAWLGAQLEKINVTVSEIRSIPDSEDTIIKNLKALSKEADFILMTGGLGPTKDDVTKKAIAKYLDVDLVFDEVIFDQMKKLFEKYNIDLKETHKSQAYIPRGCTVITNHMGTAQGMWMEKDGKVILSMPGVPYEMQYIMEHGGLDKILQRNLKRRIFHKTIMTAGWGETMIEEKISNIVETFPNHLKVAYLPSLGSVRVRVSSLTGDQEEVVDYAKRITSALGDIVYGYDDVTLSETIGQQLKDRNLTLGTAESCTGGYLAHMITSTAGSSEYFQGSIIAYANHIKKMQLGVKEQTLKTFGAVSEQTVREMVAGAIAKMGVNIAISTSGIAGPGGGSPEKPVGTIWIAVGDKSRVITRRLQLSKNRLKNIEYTSIAALNLLRKFLLGR
ncbi:CinA family nicotinamide mononucleotide deamidase-related protein [Portibacter marinus]|uniref:CinA family nicotinamide mononucleotide deamidase-related protein n=1 Tax=Portibacter marinus TaxID=2898660 RepID=UPI001F1DB4B9|nr:CinA family nicotinamide mononucleotide deamidase-related protein [Portibacter marinus]